MSDDLMERLRIFAKFDPDQAAAVNEIERLRARETRLREVLKQYSCGCSGPCWYPKDSPSCGLKARTALEEEKKGQ
jgi:hypothetical protein